MIIRFMKHCLALVFLLLSLSAYAQEDGEFRFKKVPVVYGLRVSASSPHPWLKLNLPLNVGFTFDRKKDFFLLGIDLWMPNKRNTDVSTSSFEGWGLQFNYGRFITTQTKYHGYYLMYNFRYQDTNEFWSGNVETIDSTGKYIVQFKSIRKNYEVYESTLGIGLKSPIARNFYFDLMTGAGLTINIDYYNYINVFTKPSYIFRAGIGYMFN